MKPADKHPSAMWFFLKRYKKIYITLFLITITYAVLESVNISILLPLFDTVLNNTGREGKLFTLINAVISHMPFKQPFMNVFLLAILLVIFKEIAAFVRIRLIGYGVGKVVCDVKEEVFDKFSFSDYQFFLDNKQGKLIYDLLTASGRLGNCLQFFPDLVTAVLMTVTIGVLLFSISVKMTIFLMVVGIVYSVAMHFLAQRISYNIGSERAMASTEANVIANELIDGIKHIKVSGSFDIWRGNFRKAVRKFKDLVIRDFIWVNVPDRMIQVIPVVILTAIAFYLHKRTDAAEFLTRNLVTMGVYIYAFYRLSPYLASFGRLRMQIMGSLPDVELLYEDLLKETNFIKDGTLDIRDFRREIRFSGVNFAYKGSKGVLRDINLSVEAGKTTAVVGSSGSGKTTLINLMVRLFDPDSGSITVDGVDLKQIRHSSLIHLIGMVSQDTFIFNGTIKDNIIFGLENVSEDKLIEASKHANAHGFIEGFPSKYDTVVGDKGLKLSGGQRQRIAIARAILRDPKILILDEATSSLDYHSEVTVQQALNTVSKNRTVVVIAHRLSTIINADKIVVLDRFKIADQGTHAELISRKGIYKSLYESQGKLHDIQTGGNASDE